MKYRIDHDFHIHSHLSLCSGEPLQTSGRILQYALDSGFSKICLTNHFWDEDIPVELDYYLQQDFSHLCRALPLPESEKVDFLFGAETEFDKTETLGISKKRLEQFDFVIIPTTHLHMPSNVDPKYGTTAEGRAKLWVKRLDALLEMDLPFEKIGIPHLAANKLAHPRENYLRVLELLPEAEMERLFAKAAEKGVGIELNRVDILEFCRDEAKAVMRPFQIAKYQGCKFYLGSDAHRPEAFRDAVELFSRAVSYLDLKETDKFHIK